MTRVSAVGSWPGTDIREALRTVRDLLVDAESGTSSQDSAESAPGLVTAVPHLPELPARGPGADLVGRTAGLLVDLHVDRQPAGWRLVDRPGRDGARTAAMWRQDLDELAEAYDGWSGPLKVQAAGPWTLAANIELTRGERIVGDPGARRDLAASLTEGLVAHLRDVARLVPGADVTLQLDEPSLPAVLSGALPTRSGFGTLRSVDRQVVGRVLADTIAAVRRDGAAGAGAGEVWVHCCHPDVPVELLRGAGADVISVDTGSLTDHVWERLAEALESGVGLAAGAVPTDLTGRSRVGDTAWRTVTDTLIDRWSRLGLSRTTLGDITLTPACGLAGASPDQARHVLRTCADAAKACAEAASD